MKEYLPTIAKALVACAAAAAGSLAVAASDGNISTAEVFTAIGAALAAGGVVWGVPNRQA